MHNQTRQPALIFPTT